MDRSSEVVARLSATCWYSGPLLEDVDFDSVGWVPEKRKRNGSVVVGLSCARLLTPERDEHLVPGGDDENARLHPTHCTHSGEPWQNVG